MVKAVTEQGQMSPLRTLLLWNLALTALVFAVLEMWRPLYFLTDDNFDGLFPILVGMGRRIAGGQSPFIADDVFGGNYDLLRDCSAFFWHPIYLLAALLANTPARFFIIDFVALFFLMLASSGFVCLAHFLRDELALNLSDVRLTLFAQSFTFSMIVLCTGSSWVNFLGNHSALPWLALGILQKSWRRGLGLVTLFSVHQILGGHLAALISNTFFLSLFAVGVALWRRSFLPIFSWIAGYSLALLLLSFLILPAFAGFLTADRAGGLSANMMTRFAMPAALFPFSYFFATSSSLVPVSFVFGACPPYYSAAFASCAAAWALIPALCSRLPWRPLEILSLGLVAVATLFVIRPIWVSEIMIHLPLLKSLRWPFREILQLQFFLHLFFVIRPPGGPLLFQRLIISAGVLIFISPLFFYPAPSFNPMQLDRDLLFSRQSETYWSEVKTLLAPGDVIVPVADTDVLRNDPFRVPFSLIGAYNYPILFEVKSGTGYSITAPRNQLYLQTRPATYSGIFRPESEAAVLKERPNVRFIILESIDPLRITLSSRSGPPIDLVPLLPTP